MEEDLNRLLLKQEMLPTSGLYAKEQCKAFSEQKTDEERKREAHIGSSTLASGTLEPDRGALGVKCIDKVSMRAPPDYTR